MALQPDGKIVMVGGRRGSPGLSFIVARYNADGSLDTTFGNNGWVSTTFVNSNEGATSVAIQPDGKIVVGGNIHSLADIGIARFNSNGSLDTSFDGDGKVTVGFSDFAGSYPDFLSSLKIGNDGKIVFAGGAQGLGLNYKTILGRLNVDGSLDTTFDGDGKVIDGGGQWQDIIVQPDGTIFAAGGVDAQFNGIMIAAKYNNNGSREWMYSRGQDFVRASLNGIAAQPDGKLVVVGHFSYKIIAIRLNANGTVDNSFDSTTVTPGGQAFSVAIQPDGKIVANVTTNSTTSNSFSLIRYNPNGSLDSGFGSGGIVITRLTNGIGTSDVGRKVLIQPDGKILVGGSSQLSSPTRYYFSMVRYKGEFAVPDNPLFDYDGDGKSDVSVFRPSEGVWYLNQSTNGFIAAQFGISTDRIVPADYDGDGKTDVAVFRSGTWYLNRSLAGFTAIGFSTAEDIPQPTDFDNDGKAELAVFRPSNGTWYVLNLVTNQFSFVQFGQNGDKPVVADYDGDERADYAVYRNGSWYILRSSQGFIGIQFGISTDKPVPADYDGDGKADVAVFRASNGTWYLNRSTAGFAEMQFGISTDVPAAADYDGDGRADIAVFRDGAWYLQRSLTGFTGVAFGALGDLAVPGAYVR